MSMTRCANTTCREVCTEVKDDGSRALFERLIKDEERHVDYLEAQIHSIKEMGIANYLSQQLGGE